MAAPRLALALAMMLTCTRPAQARPPADLSGLFADAVAEAWPGGHTPIGAGTAAAGDSHVLTAAHVIAGCRHVTVARDGAAPQPVALLGLDNRLDLALLEGKTASQGTGSALAAAMASGPSGALLQVVSYGQPGHGVGDPVRIEVKPSGLVQGMAEQPLLSFWGKLAPGASGSPLLDRNGRSVGMVVGQLRADPARGVAVRGADVLRFLAYFGQVPPGRAPARRPAQGVMAQGVMVQCVGGQPE